MTTPATESGLRRTFRRADERVDRFNRSMSLLGAAAALLIMGTMAADVVWRLTIGGSLPGAFEIVEVAMVMAVFMGIANAERTQTHVRVTLVTRRLPPKVSAILRIAGLVLSLGIVAWFAHATGLRAADSFARGEYKLGLLSFPLWPARSLVAVGFVMLAVELAMSIGRHSIELFVPSTEVGG